VSNTETNSRDKTLPSGCILALIVPIIYFSSIKIQSLNEIKNLFPPYYFVGGMVKAET